MNGMSEARIIKRYANRKLYDTQHSRYVTPDQIAEMIRHGDDVKIVDNNDGGTKTISGTSMATPHVAGVAALYLSKNASASPGAVRDALVANATQAIVKKSKTTNAHLLYTAY